MPILDGSNPPLSQQEKKIRRLANEDMSSLLRASKKVYRLSVKIFELLPVNWKPRGNQDLVHLILLLRAMENSRAIEMLVRNGYLSPAAGLAANSVEVFAQARYIKLNVSKADEWLSHTADRSVWQVTGHNGLLAKLSKPEIELRYKELCSIKHTQSRSKAMNYDANGSRFALYSSPIWEPEIAGAIIGYGLSCLGDVAYDSLDLLRDVIDPREAKSWENKYKAVQSFLRAYFA